MGTIAEVLHAGWLVPVQRAPIARPQYVGLPAKPKRALGEGAWATYPPTAFIPVPPYLFHCARLRTHISTHCFSLPST